MPLGDEVMYISGPFDQRNDLNHARFFTEEPDSLRVNIADGDFYSMTGLLGNIIRDVIGAVMYAEAL